MKKEFSKTWKSSTQPRKQRKYVFNLSYHLKNTLMSAHLSPELRKQHRKRSMPVRKNDTVKIMRGSFRGKSGKVQSVSTKRFAAYIEGIETSRRDGTKVLVPVKASNLMTITLNNEDARRLNKNA